MNKLILEKFPPLPPSTRPQVKKAITMKYNWQYDDSAQEVPVSIKNRVSNDVESSICLRERRDTYMKSVHRENGEWPSS
ncbi:hypothetical protein ACSS6W_000526 [Trichoderma asperelloides]